MRILSLIFMLGCGISVFAQDWKTLRQASIQLEYKIPSNWYVGGYWNEKACQCTGGTMNLAPDYSISMMIMASDEYGLDSLKQQKVGKNTFGKTTAPPNEIKTENFELQQSLSTWQSDTNTTVMRFSILRSENNSNNYLIYFWGEAAHINENASIITTIIKSIKTLKKS